MRASSYACVIILVWLVGLVLAMGAASAAEVRGQDDPRFQAAVALWLDDDEAQALPELAALAAASNRAAQVLLALIDGNPLLHGPWLLALPRAERLALMRAPGGLSGRSWLQAAAEDTPLAKLWLVQSTPKATGDTVREFAVLGEARAARATLNALTRRQYRGFAAMAEGPGYPQDMRYLIWREWVEDPATRARAEAEVAKAHPGDPQLARFDFRDIDPVAFEDWLASAPLAEPLRAACTALCPASAGPCFQAAFEFSSGPAGLVGTQAVLATFGTPSESLIPPELWNASRLARAALLRQSDAPSFEPAETLERARAVDACFGDALAAERARFTD